MNKIESKINILKEVRTLQKSANLFIDNIPENLAPLQEFIIFNDYCVSNEKQIDILLKVIFGDMYIDIDWFLNEWKPGYSVIVDEKEYTFNTEEEYYDYLYNELSKEKNNKKKKNNNEYKDLITSFFNILDIKEESDSGRVFSPNFISSSRALDGVELNEILRKLKEKKNE